MTINIFEWYATNSYLTPGLTTLTSSTGITSSSSDPGIGGSSSMGSQGKFFYWAYKTTKRKMYPQCLMTESNYLNMFGKGGTKP